MEGWYKDFEITIAWLALVSVQFDMTGYPNFTAFQLPAFDITTANLTRIGRKPTISFSSFWSQHWNSANWMTRTDIGTRRTEWLDCSALALKLRTIRRISREMADPAMWGSVLSASCSIDSDVTSNSWSTCTLRSASCCAHPFFLEHSLWACLSWPFRLMSSVEGSAKVSCYTQTLTSDSCVQDSPARGSYLAENYRIMLECQCFHISRRCSKSRFFSNSTSQRDSTLPLMRLISGSNKSQTSQQQLQNGPEMNIWDQQKFAI